MLRIKLDLKVLPWLILCFLLTGPVCAAQECETNVLVNLMEMSVKSIFGSFREVF